MKIKEYKSKGKTYYQIIVEKEEKAALALVPGAWTEAIDEAFTDRTIMPSAQEQTEE